MPEPQPKPVSEFDVDAVLDKIDACLPKIHKRAQDAKGMGNSPSTARFAPADLKKTRQAFQVMSEDKLLSGSGDDIKAPAEEPKKAASKNGTTKRLFFRK
jgi:hypothetical protein